MPLIRVRIDAFNFAILDVDEAVDRIAGLGEESAGDIGGRFAEGAQRLHMRCRERCALHLPKIGANGLHDASLPRVVGRGESVQAWSLLGVQSGSGPGRREYPMISTITRRGCGWLALCAVMAVPVADAKPGGPPAGTRHVQIRRDSWGVPHILAKTDVDAAYGLGFAQAEDDMTTLQLLTFTARGKPAELEGPSGVESDYLVALQDVWGTIRRRYARDLAPEPRRILEAYAAGV